MDWSRLQWTEFNSWTELLKADFQPVQFSKRVELCDRFLLKCVQSAYRNKFILLDNTHFKIAKITLIEQPLLKLISFHFK